MRGERFAAIVRAVTRRPWVAIVVVAVLGLAGAALALRLEPSAGTDTLVSPSSDVSKATDEFKRDFGDEAVVVLVKGNLQKTVLTPDLGQLIKLEGCLSGNVPAEGLRQLPPGTVIAPGVVIGENGEPQRARASRPGNPQKAGPPEDPDHSPGQYL